MTKRTPLLWGMCLLLAANPAASSAPENSNTSVTVPTEVATNQQAATSASVLQPTALHPAKPSDAAAHAEEAATPTAAHEDGVRNKTSGSGDRRLAVTTATSGSKPLAPTEKVTTKDVVPVELTAAAAERNGTAVLQCLVVIAVLALVATVFAVSTIVLCIKLSARKYKGRKPPPATEMMCISSLLPDKSPPYTRQRNPVSNGEQSPGTMMLT
uniref:P-selectin glycoprotein ligand 1 n=1 Tax=Fundulus heteroclitus TaxID=8078 RepID=A0A3Q2PFZ6_FUNHE